MIINLNDEQFEKFVARNENSILFENDIIFNRAIATGTNFIFGLSDDIQLKMINNDTYIANIKNNPYECSKVAGDISEENIDLFLDKINFKNMDIESQFTIIKRLPINDNLYNLLQNQIQHFLLYIIHLYQKLIF